VRPAAGLDLHAGFAQDRDVAACGAVGDAEACGELVGGDARRSLQQFQSAAPAPSG